MGKSFKDNKPINKLTVPLCSTVEVLQAGLSAGSSLSVPIAYLSF